MYIEQLPSEIRQTIFEVLPKSTLYQCLFVSKHWQQTAAQLIYKEILVNDANIEQLQFALIHQSANRSLQQYGHWTKTFCHNTDPSKGQHTKNLSNELLLLLSYLPNLKTIDVTDSPHFNFYMKTLYLYSDNIQLDHLERIMSKPHHDTAQDQSLYFCTLHKYRRSLTDISVCYKSESRYFNSVDILQVLPHFHCLTRLTLSNLVNEHLTIFDLLGLCPQLASLDFTSAYPVPDDVAKNQLVDFQPSHHTTLKSLSLCVPVLTPTYIQYITYSTAADMDTICLNMTRANFYNWIDTLGSQTVIRLAQRMSMAHNVCIHTDASPEQRRPQSNINKMTQFYQILHALQGNRQLQCQGIYTQHKPGEISINVYQNYFLDFQYSLGFEDFDDDSSFNDDDDDNNNGIRSPYDGLALPDHSISHMGPEILNSCSFQLFRPMERVPHGLVKYVLKHCPHLYHFKVNCTVRYSQCLLEAGTPTANRTKMPRQRTHQISRLLFKRGVVLWRELSRILVKYLPNIQECRFDKVQLLVEQVSINSTVDLSDFKQLDACYFDIAPIVKLVGLKYLNNIFLKFDYVDGGRVDWFQVQRPDYPLHHSNHKDCPYAVTSVENEYVQQCIARNPSKNCILTYRCSQIPRIFDVFVPSYPILQLSHGHQKASSDS